MKHNLLGVQSTSLQLTLHPRDHACLDLDFSRLIFVCTFAFQLYTSTRGRLTYSSCNSLLEKSSQVYIFREKPETQCAHDYEYL